MDKQLLNENCCRNNLKPRKVNKSQLTFSTFDQGNEMASNVVDNSYENLNHKFLIYI